MEVDHWYQCGRKCVFFQPMVNGEQEIDGLAQDCGGSSALAMELL